MPKPLVCFRDLCKTLCCEYQILKGSFVIWLRSRWDIWIRYRCTQQLSCWLLLNAAVRIAFCRGLSSFNKHKFPLKFLLCSLDEIWSAFRNLFVVYKQYQVVFILHWRQQLILSFIRFARSFFLTHVESFESRKLGCEVDEFFTFFWLGNFKGVKY